MALTPLDWINTIDKEARNALQRKVSRYSIEWGKWSADMNRHIRLRIDEHDPESPKLKFVFIYWVLMSQAVESAYRKSMGRKINGNRFQEVVGILEHMKESVRKGEWPNYTLHELEPLIIGGQ